MFLCEYWVYYINWSNILKIFSQLNITKMNYWPLVVVLVFHFGFLVSVFFFILLFLFIGFQFWVIYILFLVLCFTIWFCFVSLVFCESLIKVLSEILLFESIFSYARVFFPYWYLIWLCWFFGRNKWLFKLSTRYQLPLICSISSLSSILLTYLQTSTTYQKVFKMFFMFSEW